MHSLLQQERYVAPEDIATSNVCDGSVEGGLSRIDLTRQYPGKLATPNVNFVNDSLEMGRTALDS